MMKLREAMTLAATVLVLLIPVAALGLYVFNKHQWAQDRLAEVAPRYARLLGLAEQRQALTEALAQVKASRALYVYPADRDAAQSGNDAQQRVRDVFTGAGLQVLSSQVLPSKSGKGFDRIPLSVRAEGDLLALQIALSELSRQAPVVLVDELDVQAQGGLGSPNAAGSPRLAIQFSLSILWERS